MRVTADRRAAVARVLVLGALAVAALSTVRAIAPMRADPVVTADEVVARADDARRVESALETVRMTSWSKSGAERVLLFELRAHRTEDTSKTYLRITSPPDLDGMQFLLVDNTTGADERMAWLPSTKRIVMVGSGSAGRLMGSDITFEDLAIRDAVTGTHTLVEETPERWVIDTVLQGGSYTKVRTTVSRTDLVVRKLELFDAEGAAKVLEVTKTEKDGAITLPVESTMTDLRKGTKTKLEILSHRLNVSAAEIPEEMFTREYLERR